MKELGVTILQGLSTNLAQLLEMEGKLMKAYIVLTQTIFEKQLNITDKLKYLNTESVLTL